MFLGQWLPVGKLEEGSGMKQRKNLAIVVKDLLKTETKLIVKLFMQTLETVL